MPDSNYNNPLSSMSYTNKDFRSIFVELLDLTKKLTYKWDPTISNESDPGVILLKLDAIIGDKNNYNIDRNILEAFPETVTQEFSARNMYKQLAYIMPWYNSATTSVSFKWIGESLEPGEIVTIPAFTMVTDSDTTKIYTLIEDVQFSYGNDVSIGNVIQGVITDLSINGSTTLKLNNMDYNNRIYLNDYNVAENGIFISNAEEPNAGYWEKVDNLQIVPIGNRYYEFGVDSRSNSTYVEFPSDIETLIRAGLNIKYVISDGINGNVAARELVKFYEDVTIEFRGENLNLNEEIIQMYNPSGTSNGSDPEPVSQAYNSYRKIAGTFDTLVTLRDYINAIYQSGFVSNDIVSDRLTDIQSSYKIVTDSFGTSDSIIEYGRFIDSTKNDLTPYDLKLYLLHNGGLINNITSFNSTFDMEPSQSQITQQVENYLQSTRCMQHNFQDIIENIPCMYRNIYPIKIKFVPQYQLSNIQIDSVKRNIIQALFDTLNSRQVEFGEEPDYNLIYDCIINADERIKIITIDDFNYTTYATYWEKTSSTDAGRFKSIPISNFSNDPWLIVCQDSSDFSAAIKGINNPAQYTFIAENENNTVYKFNNSTQQFEEYSKLIDEFRVSIIAKSILAGVTPLYNQDNTFQYSIDQSFNQIDTDVDRVSTNLVLSPWGFNDDGTPRNYPDDTQPNVKEYTLKENETIQFLAPSFITEISYSNYVKFELVLQKETSEEPVYLLANAYNFSVSLGQYNGVKTQLYQAQEDGSYEVYVDLNNTGSATTEGSLTWFTQGSIEVELSSGRIESMTPYSAWQKEYVTLYTREPVYSIPADTEYKLKYGDSITFFWKETDEDDAPYVYRCYKGLQYETETERSPIIKPTFTINGSGPSNYIINPNTLTSTGTIPYDANPYRNYQKVYSMYGDNTLSGTKSIDIRRLNQVTLIKNTNYYYFITNTIETSNDVSQYVMEFEVFPRFVPKKYYTYSNGVYTQVDTQPSNWGYGTVVYYELTNIGTYSQISFTYDYTLKTDEYFIYTNNNMTEYELLGAGTLIRLLQNIYNDSLPVLKVDTVAYEDIAMRGLESFTGKTKLISVDTLVREQQVYNLTGGDSISIQINSDYEGTSYSQLVEGELKTGIAFPYFNTMEAQSIEGLTIQYSTGDSGFQTLPSIDIDDANSNWLGTAILNIDATYDDPQIIDNTIPAGINTSINDKQSLQQVIVRTVEDSDDTSNSYYPEDPFNSTNQIQMLVNVSLTKVGGINIDVTYLDAYGERTNINIFAYELNPAFNTLPFSKTAEYGIRMNFMTSNIENKNNITASTDSSGNTVVAVSNIKLETGYNYILGINNTSSTRSFWLRYNDTDYIHCLNTDNIDVIQGTWKYPDNMPSAEQGATEGSYCQAGSNWYTYINNVWTQTSSPNNNNSLLGLQNGKYYFLLDNINREINELQVIINGSDEEAYLVFDNLVKCIPSTYFQDTYNISFEEIETEIQKYDYNGLFKYNYNVPIDILIADPLEAKQFFNENHVCNSYTIGNVNLLIPSNSDTNSNASSIDVINNR